MAHQEIINARAKQRAAWDIIEERSGAKSNRKVFGITDAYLKTLIKKQLSPDDAKIVLRNMFGKGKTMATKKRKKPTKADEEKRFERAVVSISLAGWMNATKKEKAAYQRAFSRANRALSTTAFNRAFHKGKKAANGF